jgi:hypothetical protein
MGLQRAGRPGLSDALIARAHQWAEQSCLDQQLPLKVADRTAIAQVAALLGVGSVDVRRPALAGERTPTERRAA